MNKRYYCSSGKSPNKQSFFHSCKMNANTRDDESHEVKDEAFVSRLQPRVLTRQRQETDAFNLAM